MARRANLEKWSVARIERLLERKRRAAKIAPLEQERNRLRRRLEKIEEKIARLTGAAAAGPARSRKKRKMSAAARKRIAAAQRKRWAVYRRKNAAKGKPSKPRLAVVKPTAVASGPG